MLSKPILNCPLLKEYIVNQKELLGKGAFGAVYCATKTETEEECAIKIQYEPVDAGSKEISIMIDLGDHPHIIRNIDYFPKPKDQKHYNYNIIVMEKANENLNEYLGRHDKKLDLPILIQLFLDIVSELDYAHSKNVAHCDIKPGNILVFKKSRKNKLKKFGFVRKN